MNGGRRFGEGHDTVYPLLARLEPGLMIDAGAAIGLKTAKMLKHSPGSHVIAYEPFPGNLPYLNRYAEREPRVTVRPAALADRKGRETLNVASVVSPDEARAAKRLPGFSALGHLGRWRRKLRVEVDVVTIDDEVAEHVRFVKIDVQGGELRVLKGAARTMERFGIDLIFVEFTGSLRVLRFLEARGYVIFDNLNLAWPTRRYYRNWFRSAPTEMPRWDGLRPIRNTMGGRSAVVWLSPPFRGFRAYCAWFLLTYVFLSGVQTDLLCVHRSYLDRFFDSIADPPPA